MFIVALLLVPFLPLYVKRTMLRSWRVDHLGDVIEWGWKLRTLNDYWSNYNYYRPEQKPALWLGVNLVLALIYALMIAFGVDWVMAWRKRRVVV
jgi:hypothetical protein